MHRKSKHEPPSTILYILVEAAGKDPDRQVSNCGSGGNRYEVRWRLRLEYELYRIFTSLTGPYSQSRLDVPE